MDLLIAARQIQSDRFDSGRVAKEGGMWIVKRDMSILQSPYKRCLPEIDGAKRYIVGTLP